MVQEPEATRPKRRAAAAQEAVSQEVVQHRAAVRVRDRAALQAVPRAVQAVQRLVAVRGLLRRDQAASVVSRVAVVQLRAAPPVQDRVAPRVAKANPVNQEVPLEVAARAVRRVLSQATNSREFNFSCL